MSNPPTQTEFVEMIVREVMRRLLAQGVTVMSGNATASGSANVRVIDEAQTELTLTDRLVTLETLRERLQGVRQITVAKKAIVTPAVRDELKRKKIDLIRQ